ncbi:MAG: transcription-repair coupling factor, partial [Muribaculaceae bacterium]|nr:transcription-repair coupling factor [Muribaculaceae bacterium]
MEIRELEEIFPGKARVKAVEKALAEARKNGTAAEARGLAGSAAAMLLASLPPQGAPVLVAAADLDQAGYLYQDLVKLLGSDEPQPVMFLPSGYKRDIRYGQPDPPQQILRTETISRWGEKDASRTLRFVVSYPEALAEKVASRKLLEEHTLQLAAGKEINLTETCKWLRDNGFKEEDYVYEPGHFAVRGSILDIFGYSNELPYRIDLFGDEIESIRTFNIETQLSEQKVDMAVITANMAQGSGGEGVSVADFMPAGTLVVTADPSWLVSRVEAVASQSFSASAAYSAEGDADAMCNLVNPAAFAAKLREFPVLRLSLSKGEDAPGSGSGGAVDFQCSPQGLFHKNFDLLGG